MKDVKTLTSNQITNMHHDAMTAHSKLVALNAKIAEKGMLNLTTWDLMVLKTELDKAEQLLAVFKEDM